MGCNHSKVSNEIVSGSYDKEPSNGCVFREFKVNLITPFFYNHKHMRRKIPKLSRLLVHRVALVTLCVVFLTLCTVKSIKRVV